MNGQMNRRLWFNKESGGYCYIYGVTTLHGPVGVPKPSIKTYGVSGVFRALCLRLIRPLPHPSELKKNAKLPNIIKNINSG